jgi:two-component system sensor kinase FixL
MASPTDASSSPPDLAHRSPDSISVGTVFGRSLAQRSHTADEINQRIFDTSLDLILVTDKRGKLLRVSPSSQAILGHQADEMAGHLASEFLYPPDLENTREEMRQARRGRQTRHFECRYVHKGGWVVALNWTGVWSEQEQRHFFIGRDMSELKQAERRMQELQSELIRSSRLYDLRHTVAALAHEVNQPLTAIANYLSGAKRMFAKGNQSAGEQAISHVAEQSERVREIIFRLRELVSNKAPSDPRPERISSTIDEAAALARIGSDRMLHLRMLIAEDAENVVIDKVEIQQVFLNLIRNAMDATAATASPELEVSARRVDDMIEIRLADNGPGLPEPVRARLFQPFVTTKPEGIGIGLWVCRAIIEAHGGEIHADTLGGGAVFRFTVPRWVGR